MMLDAFANPATVWITAAAASVLLLATVIIGAMSALRLGPPALRRELWLRTGSWGFLLPLMFGPVLAGRAWTIGAVTLLGLVCLREFGRATGLFRQSVVTAVVAVGIFCANFAALDHWYGFYVALWPLTVAVLAAATIPQDQPAGYIQRTALGIFAYMLFGAGLSHLSYMANDADYRPFVLMLLAATALNDVAAFTCGKLLGGPKLLPGTSPNKTVSGALGALAVTTALVAFVAGRLFAGTPMDSLPLLLLFGAIISVAGQGGDLVLSSIKRDLGIKDMGALLPGHGGVLDRFNSLLLVAPAAFHYVGYFIGFGLDQPTRLFTGGGG